MNLTKNNDILKENHLEAAAFVPGPNFYYLTGIMNELNKKIKDIKLEK